MKDAYSFNADDASLDDTYQDMAQAYRNVFRRCGLPVLMAEADSGAIGGKDSHEFLLPTDTGEDTVITCSGCDYVANAEKAESVYPAVEPEPEAALEEVATPGIKTIAGLAEFVGVPESKTLKAVFYMADGEPVFVTIRGDLDVNEVKLKNALHCDDLRFAEDEEVRAAGLVAGSASAVGIRGIRKVADPSIESGNNFVVGANKPDTHMTGAQLPPGLRSGPADGHCAGPARAAVRPVRRCAGGDQGSGGGTHFQAGHFLQRDAGRELPRR